MWEGGFVNNDDEQCDDWMITSKTEVGFLLFTIRQRLRLAKISKTTDVSSVKQDVSGCNISVHDPAAGQVPRSVKIISCTIL